MFKLHGDWLDLAAQDARSICRNLVWIHRVCKNIDSILYCVPINFCKWRSGRAIERYASSYIVLDKFVLIGYSFIQQAFPRCARRAVQIQGRQEDR